MYMKFVYLSSLFMACALSAGAQGIYQFADPGFEQDFTKIGSYKEPGNDGILLLLQIIQQGCRVASL